MEKQTTILFFGLLALFSLALTSAGIDENLTVETNLTIGASYPTILNVTIDDSASNVTLIANNTKTVTCTSRIVDFNNESNIINVTGAFYDSNNASFGDSVDNNNYYANNSCFINTSFDSWDLDGTTYQDDIYHVLATCTFEVEYYANPSSDWVCNVTVTDNDSLQDNNNDSIEILSLLAMGIQDSIDYGTVNATYVSEEQQVDVENLGNVMMDLQISAYAETPQDGLAMNCTLGLNGTISQDYERYNLTDSTSTSVSLTEFLLGYKKVANTDVLESIGLNFRHNDETSEAINPTYWRIYVPTEVAGTCEGNLVFSAVAA